jgi:cation diffusion facilitator family transporter
MFISFLTNALLSTMKVVIGFFSKSSALVADGIHSFSDLITDVVALFGNVLARKPEDKKHPFGHGRIEYVTSAMIGIIVIMIGLFLIFSVVQKEIEIPSKIVIVVSLFTIASKFIVSRYLIRKGRELDNQILIASGKESSTDVISSIVVLIASILIQFEGYFHPFLYADKVASVIVGLFIIHTGFMILKENISILIGEKESNTAYYEEVKNIILESELIHRIDNLIIMKYGYFYSLTVEVSMNSDLSLKEAHDEIEAIEQKLKQKNERTKYIHIHMNPYYE